MRTNPNHGGTAGSLPRGTEIPMGTQLQTFDREEARLKSVVWPSHEPLAFLWRRGGLRRGYEAEYERYHTAANTKLLAELLGPGGRHIIHFYKGMGLKHEAAEMRRCYALARAMHRQGLGESSGSGTPIWPASSHRRGRNRGRRPGSTRSTTR